MDGSEPPHLVAVPAQRQLIVTHDLNDGVAEARVPQGAPFRLRALAVS